jgi:hypothetical protein
LNVLLNLVVFSALLARDSLALPLVTVEEPLFKPAEKNVRTRRRAKVASRSKTVLGSATTLAAAEHMALLIR